MGRAIVEGKTMNGDPFGVKTIIDKAKQIWNGVQLYYEGLLAEEKRKYEAAHQVVTERDPIPAPYADCPHCHAKESMRDVTANVVRCMQCGWQPRVPGPRGISRAELESWQGPDAEHKRKFQQGFGSALSRFGPRK
jgi:Zn ribbon nucleic-acid-binding protein